MNVPALALALQQQFKSVTIGRADLPRSRMPSQSHALSRESIDADRAPKDTLRRQRVNQPHASPPAPGCDFDVCDSVPLELKKLTVARDATVMVPPPTTKGWNPDDLVALGPRMEHVPRVSAVRDGERLGEIIKEYEESGVPLIIEDWEKMPAWPGEKLFGVQWLLEHGDEMISVRDCLSRKDKAIPFKEFIEKSRTISEYAEEGEDERLYGKDAVCPKEWREWLMKSNIPEVLKPGSSEDVLELLPAPERVETLMCYYGVGNTFTAAHKDLCASSGHNLMCFTERGGLSFWFMTRSSDAARAALYFQKLGAELDHEMHVATPQEFAKAPFTVYIAEQRTGDFVLVPRRSCHQVVNHGGITAKMSWSRMTIEGLCTAFHHELPVYRRVCRSETYRVKLLVYRALLKYTEDLEKEQQQFMANNPTITETLLKPRTERASSRASQLSDLTPPSSPESLWTILTPPPDEADPLPTLMPEHERLIADVRILLSVYDKILKEEHHGDTQCEMRIRRSNSVPDTSSDSFKSDSGNIPPVPVPAKLYHDGLTCDFCGADIFQSFFECRRCCSPNSQDDSVTICPSCYVEGRACSCAIMTPMQQFPMDMLFEVQHRAQKLLNFKGYGEIEVKVIALSHQAIDKIVNHPGIFAAACQILRLRAITHAKQPTLACRKKNGNSHRVPYCGALPCKKCHSARCFRHILIDGYYVVDALKQHARDTTQETWHTQHKLGAKRLAAATHTVQEAEENGRPCDMSVSLVLLAQKFTSCRPINDKLKPGWYDDASYIELEETAVPESGVEGFAGPVLGESDEETDDDAIDISSSESFASHPKPRQRAELVFRINKKSLKCLPSPQARLHLPKEIPYVLLDRLTPEEKEKYLLKNLQVPAPIFRFASESQDAEPFPATTEAPMRLGIKASTRRNVIVVRRPKGSPKRPPGKPAREMQGRVPRPRPRKIVKEALKCSSSDEDEALQERIPYTKFATASNQAKPVRTQQILVLKRRKPRPRRRQLTLSNSPGAPDAHAGDEGIRPAIEASPIVSNSVDKSDSQMNDRSEPSRRNKMKNATTSVQRSRSLSPLVPSTHTPMHDVGPASPAFTSMFISPPVPLGHPAVSQYATPLNTVSTESFSRVASPTYNEIIRKLEKSEEDAKLSRQEKEKLLIKLQHVEEEFANTNSALIEELEQAKTEVRRLKSENMRLRQRLNAPPTSNSTGVPANVNEEDSPRPDHTPPYNTAPVGFNKQNSTPPGPHTPCRKGNVVSAMARRTPPVRVPRPPRYIPNSDDTPSRHANISLSNRKRRRDSPIDGIPSTPIRQHSVDNDLEVEDARIIDTPLTDSDRGTSYDTTPVTPIEGQARPLRKYGRRASTNEFKRRKCGEETMSIPLPQTPRRGAVEEDEFFLPGELLAARTPVTPRRPVHTTS